MSQEQRHLISDWERTPPTLQLALSTEALKRARLIIGAQAQMLADQMDRGALPSFDGPDALRLLAMILGQDDEAPSQDIPMHELADTRIPTMA